MISMLLKTMWNACWERLEHSKLPEFRKKAFEKSFKLLRKAGNLGFDADQIAGLSLELEQSFESRVAVS